MARIPLSSGINRPTSIAANNNPNFIVKRESGALLYFPRGTQHTVVRPYSPLRSDGTPEQVSMFAPGSVNTLNPEWFCQVPVVSFYGANKVSFALTPPEDMPLNDQPVSILYRAANKAVKDKHPACHKWASMLIRSKDSMSSLTLPGEIFVFAAVLMEFNKERFSPPKGSADQDPVILIGLKSSAFDSFLTCIEERSQAAGNVWQDPCVLDGVGGDFASFIQAKYADAEVDSGAGFGGNRKDNKSQSFEDVKYTCTLFSEYNRIRAADLAGISQLLLTRTRPLREYIDFKSPAEQVGILSGNFPFELIELAFRDTPFWDDVPAIYRNASRGKSGEVTPTLSSESKPHTGFGSSPSPYRPPVREESPQSPAPPSEPEKKPEGFDPPTFGPRPSGYSPAPPPSPGFGSWVPSPAAPAVPASPAIPAVPTSPAIPTSPPVTPVVVQSAPPRELTEQEILDQIAKAQLGFHGPK